MNPFAWIQKTLLADSEAESERNGYLSWRGEWHAAAWGFSVALIAVLTGQWQILVAGVGWLFTRAGDKKAPGWLPYPRQFVKESGYLIGHAAGGVLVGIVLKVGLMGGL
jgi:hypothetical protein